MLAPPTRRYPRISHGHNIVSFFGLEFGADDEQAARLAAALQYVARHCTFPHGPIRISAEGNGFSAQSRARLRAAVEGCAGIQEIYVGYQPMQSQPCGQQSESPRGARSHNQHIQGSAAQTGESFMEGGKPSGRAAARRNSDTQVQYI